MKVVRILRMLLQEGLAARGLGGVARGLKGLLIVLVGIVAWMQKGNTTVCRNILLVRNRSTFHQKNLASAEP